MLAFALLPCRAMGQTVPDAETQRQMLVEERAFLAGMEPGLQHKQTLAVRAAMEGDFSALEEIRASRNKVPALPEGVTRSFPREGLCLFAPSAPA